MFLLIAIFLFFGGLEFRVSGAERSIELPVETVDDVSCISTDNNISTSLNYSEYGLCERYMRGMAPLCEDVISNGDYIFVPNVRVSLDNIVRNVQTQFRIFDLIGREDPTSSSTDIDCFETARQMFCYWYFIPCGTEATPGLPRPLCMDECLTISAKECISEWETAVSLIETDPTRVPSGFGLPDCCDLSMLTGPIHNCCQPLGPVLNRQELSPPYEVCFPELATEMTTNETEFNYNSNTTVITTTTTIAIIVGCTSAVVVLLLVVTTSIILIIVQLNWRKKRSRLMRSSGTDNVFPRSAHSTLVNNSNYGISPQENVSYTPQQFNGSVAKVRSVYRREMESHNLVIPIQWLTIKEVLGEGEFGTVRRGLMRKGKTERIVAVAIKELKGLSSGSQEDIDGLIEESLKMKEFHHRHVMGLYGICLDNLSSPMVIMPFMSNGALLTYLRGRRPEWEQPARHTDVVTECGLLSMCRQIALGMEYLAKLRYVHRDLAARNCMVDSDYVIKVADFGLSRDVYNRNYYQSVKGGKVPARWMPVEALLDGLWTEKSDVWAYGVTCWEIFTFGYIPYPGVDIFSIVHYLQAGNRLPKPDLCSDTVYEVMQQCWKGKAEDRPTFSQLRSTIESILESKAGYVDLNVHTTLEAGLQATTDPSHSGIETLRSLQEAYTEIPTTDDDLTESGCVNV